MRVALVHYWLKTERGGEKVLRALCDLFPKAVIFTHVANDAFAAAYFAGHEIRQTFISKLPFSQRRPEKYLPLMPLALEELNVQDFDLVISSESGPAKGVIPRPDAHHICYCHTPMRYIWNMYDVYKRRANFATRLVMPFFAHRLRQWDISAAARVDSFIANSGAVAARINKYYRREAEVIYPPVDVEKFTIPSFGADGDDCPYSGAYLWVGELVSYKRPDIAVEAFTKMRRKLIVVGNGPEKKKLMRGAGDAISFLDRVSTDELRRAYGACKALVFPGEEDFGIVPVEAMATGTPVIAYGRGGAAETVEHNRTGILYERPDAEGLMEAVDQFERIEKHFEPDILRAHASSFSRGAFKASFASMLRRKGLWSGSFEDLGGQQSAAPTAAAE